MAGSETIGCIETQPVRLPAIVALLRMSDGGGRSERFLASG